MAIDMSVSISAECPEDLRESLGQLRASCVGLDQFAGGMFEELQSLHGELDQRRKQLDEARCRLEQQAEELHQRQSQLEDEREKHQRVRGELASELSSLEQEQQRLAAENRELKPYVTAEPKQSKPSD